MIPLDLSGKVALVTGVGDNESFAWFIAKGLQAAGARLVFAVHPRMIRIVEGFLTGDGPEPVPAIVATSTDRTVDQDSVQAGRLLRSRPDSQVDSMLRPRDDNSSRTALPMPPAQTRVPTYVRCGSAEPSDVTAFGWPRNGSR